MFIFTEFVGSHLKESFECYKRLKVAYRKDRNDRYYASRSYKNKQRSQKYDVDRQRIKAKTRNN